MSRIDVVALRREKLIENERLLRRANELIDAGREDEPRGREELFLCECSDLSCSANVELTCAEYAEVREFGNRYVLVPGHETAAVDRVVEHRDGYLIVAKDV